jgi:two-component system, NtrC family, sensor histidine kinase PilS
MALLNRYFPTVENPDSFWVSLTYFNVYRLAIAGVFMLIVLVYGDSLNLGSHDLRLFTYTCLAYFLAASLFAMYLRAGRAHFNLQLSLHVIADVVAVTLLMYSSGGIRSGLGMMLLVSLAGAGLVGQGRLVLFYAALASIAVLCEQSYWVLAHDTTIASYGPAGMLSIGFFASAWVTHQLAQRTTVNEELARQRGLVLARQMRINQLVIEDMQDGVLVIDGRGRVRQHNPQAERLLGLRASQGSWLVDYLPELAAAVKNWRDNGGPAAGFARVPVNGNQLRTRFVLAGGADDNDVVVFLEDMSKIQEQAQQLKLASLGRLTANIAHEIRNPLSAISHAAELLREEGRAENRERLYRILQDNSQRIDHMVREILELGRRDRAQPEPIRLGAFLSGFVEEFAQIEKIDSSGFVLSLDPELTVSFDRGHLHRVLWNLAVNAWRHGSKGAGSVQIFARRDLNRIELDLVDDGSGVSPEFAGQLFEPFFTTHNSGTGLGLYIARELCTASGATLEFVGNAPGAHFRIQCRPSQAPQDTPGAAPAAISRSALETH